MTGGAGHEPQGEPLVLLRETVRPEWIDYNGHLSEAYYVLVFGFATDALYDHVGMDDAFRRRTKTSVSTVEAHINYLSEVGEGAPLEIATRVLDLDDKRARVFHAMHRGDDGTLLATIELMLLHVDTTGSRSAPFPDDVLARLRALHEAQAGQPMPPQAGRAISIPRRA